MDNENPINNDKKTVKDTKFKEGNPGGPGRPKGSKNYLTQLEEAITKYETDKDKKLFTRLIERAFINDTVLINVIKKFIPDKTHTEIETTEPLEIIIKHDNGKSRS